MHHEYLQSVLWHIRQAQASAANIRRRALAIAQQNVRFGADPDAVAKALPRPAGLMVHPKVMQAASRAFGSDSAVFEGYAAAHQAANLPANIATAGATLDAARAARNPATLAGFDAGVALAAGAARTRGVAPRALGPGGRAGWYMTFGVEGAGADVAGQVLGTAAAASGTAPGILQGIKTAISTIDGGGDVGAAVLAYGGIPLGVISAASMSGILKLSLGAVLGLSALTGLVGIGVGLAFGMPGATALVKAGQNKVGALTQSTEKAA